MTKDWWNKPLNTVQNTIITELVIGLCVFLSVVTVLWVAFS